MPDRLERLRTHVSTTVEHATAVLADLTSLDEMFQTLMPSLADMTNREREELVARICGFDEALGGRLRELVEAMADVLAGLTTADSGQLWLQQHLQRLEAGEDAAA